MTAYIRKILFTFPQLALRLGGDSVSHSIVLYVRFLYAAIHWKYFGAHTLHVSLHYRGVRFDLDLIDITDVAALEEIYVKDEYVWDLPFTPRTILDLGASYGDTALYYHSVYPEATIYAVEASPASFTRLCEHTRHIPQIVPINIAVSDKDGEVDLHIMPESSLGNSLIKRGNDMETVPVAALTLRSFSEKYGAGKKFDLVKFDVEGAEAAVFLIDDPKKYANAYIGEVHFDLFDHTSEEFLGVFSDFEMRVIDVIKGKRAMMMALQRSAKME